MTFESHELSRQRGQPIELFYFRYGVGALSYYAYTSAEEAVSAASSVGGAVVTYQPIPIQRENVETTGTLDRSTIRVSLPRDADLLSHFISYPPTAVVSLVIRQAHFDAFDLTNPPALDAPAIWVGRVVGAKFTGSLGTLDCEPISTSMRRLGLRRRYQHGCPLALYGDECRADKPAATTNVVVTGVGTNTITMPANWFGAISVTKYLGGLVEWTTAAGNIEVYTILQITGGKDLVISGIVRGLSAGGTVSVSLGCNRTRDDCLNLHVESGVSPAQGNINNYGGQDWIPTENPIGLVNQFY